MSDENGSPSSDSWPADVWPSDVPCALRHDMAWWREYVVDTQRPALRRVIEAVKTKRGVWIAGETGRGKSAMLAFAIGLYCLTYGRRADVIGYVRPTTCWLNVPTWSSHYRYAEWSMKEEMQANAESAELCVFDDVAATADTEFIWGALYAILEERSSNDRLTFVSSLPLFAVRERYKSMLRESPFLSRLHGLTGGERAVIEFPPNATDFRKES